MNLSCGSRTIKYLIFTFNFFFVITGIILVAVGASIHTYYVQYDYFLNSKYFSLPNLLIATGSLIFVICFLGCYGAIKNSWILLSAFSVCLSIIFVFEFSAGIAGYVLRDQTSNYLETSLTNSLKQYYDNVDPATGLWDIIQPKFQCCGVKGPEDWKTVTNNTSLPLSCCPPKPGQIESFYCNMNPVVNATVTDTTSARIKASGTQEKLEKMIDSADATAAKLTRRRRQATDPLTNASNETQPTNSTESITVTSSTPVSTTTTVPPQSTTPPYQIGCENAFGSWVKAHAVDIGAVCFTLAVLQLIGIGFSCHLSKQVKNSYYST